MKTLKTAHPAIPGFGEYMTVVHPLNRDAVCQVPMGDHKLWARALVRNSRQCLCTLKG